MKARLAPFLILLEARYAPLLFAVAPQAFAVYLWLFPRPTYDGWGEIFAIIGAIGFEAVYVGAIAWAEEGKAGGWTWLTAGAALVFSVAVAIFVYLPQGWWAALHAGFPIVAFCYTMQLHKMAAVRRVRNVAAQRRSLVRRLARALRTARGEVRTQSATLRMELEEVRKVGEQASQERGQVRSEADALRTEAARLADLIRMEEAKGAEAREQLRMERERAMQLSAQVRTAQEEKEKAQALLASQSAELETMSALVGVDVHTLAQLLRDKGVALRIIAEALGVSEKTIRNWTVEVITNGRH